MWWGMAVTCRSVAGQARGAHRWSQSQAGEGEGTAISYAGAHRGQGTNSVVAQQENDRGGRALEQGREREVRWRLPDISAFYIGVRRG
jgi:hypothetical protein